MERAVAVKEGAVKVWSTAKKDPPRTMKFLSCIAGLLLVIGGFFGFFSINPLKAVISLYNMAFGILILVTELKSWPIISTFQKRVDIYFHLLSVPKGKGGFYFFVGFLAFCASVENFDQSTLCVLIVSIVGLLHLFSWGGTPKEDTAQFSEGTQGLTTAGSSTQFSESMTSFGIQVLKDNPGIVRAIADNPEIAKQGMSCAFSSGSSAAQAHK